MFEHYKKIGLAKDKKPLLKKRFVIQDSRVLSMEEKKFHIPSSPLTPTVTDDYSRPKVCS